MSDDGTGLLRRQFDLTWALFEHHLERLEPRDHLWQPAPLCWTLHLREGVWVPDFAAEEPDPVPVPTVAWLGWHIGWWWGTALELLQEREALAPESVHWPGPDGAVEWLRSFRGRWLTLLPELDPRAPAPFPWPEGTGHTVADTAAWVNSELMKNAAEIGQLRMLRAVGAPGQSVKG